MIEQLQIAMTYTVYGIQYDDAAYPLCPARAYLFVR